MKNKIKVLPLPRVYDFDEEDLKDIQGNFPELREIEPKFKRNGWYYNRETGECWRESGKRAWLSNANQFLYELNLRNHTILPERVMRAIKALQAYNVCPRELNELLYLNKCAINSRDIERRTSIVRMKFEKEYNKRRKHDVNNHDK